MSPRRLSILVFAVVLAACRDGRTPTGQDGAPGVGAPGRSSFTIIDTQTVTCGLNCTLVPGPIPGAHSETRDRGADSASGFVVISWPESFNSPTWVEMRVTGSIARQNTGSMVPAFWHLNNKVLMPLDADGAYWGFNCEGHFLTDFRKFGNPTNALHACTRSTNNWSEAPTVSDFAVQGLVEGSGNVVRSAQGQPSSPGYANCNGPCVFLKGGSHTVSIAPASDKLSMLASPNAIVQGDTVTFSLAVTSFTFAAGAKEWMWVPHRRAIAGVIVDSSGDSRTGSCGTSATCVITVDRTGVMYAKALLVPSRWEQASARVEVTPLALRATVDKPQVGHSGDTVTLTVFTTPKRRDFSSISVVGQRGGPSGACIPSEGTCRIAVTAPDSLIVTATTTQGIPLSTSVFVDSIPCPTGDPTLDLTAVRTMIDSLYKVGGDQGPASQRLERAAAVIDSAGTLIVRYLPSLPGSGPCTTWNAFEQPELQFPQIIPGVMTIVAVAHTHPYKPSIDRTPSNCPKDKRNRIAGNGPSNDDWMNYYTALDRNRFFQSQHPGTSLLSPLFKSLVIDSDRVWTMGPWDGAWKDRGEGKIRRYAPDPVQVGTNIQGYERVKPYSLRSCMSISTEIPETGKP